MSKSKMQESQSQDAAQAQQGGQADFDPSGGMGNAAMQEEMTASDGKGPITAPYLSELSKDTDFDREYTTVVATYGRGKRHGVKEGAMVDVGSIRGRVTGDGVMSSRVTFWHNLRERLGTGDATIKPDKKWTKGAFFRYRHKKVEKEDDAEWTPGEDKDDDQADRKSEGE